MIEAQIFQIKEGISQIKNLLYCMGKFIKEIEKGLDENKDEKIDKIMFEDMCRELDMENKKLREELEHYKNTEAIQKSNDASRYKYPSTSYVDRELNVIN